MNIIAKLMNLFFAKFGVPNYGKILEMEKTLQEREDAILPSKNSPERFEIPLEAMKTKGGRRMFTPSDIPSLLSNITNVRLSLKSIDNNPKEVKQEISKTELKEIVEYALSQGASSIGYTNVPKRLIFQDTAILYENAIVFSMEMDNERIAKAPSKETLKTVIKTYDDLGKVVNTVAAELRERGFGEQASHSLGGVTLYPPLAQKAGLGWIGRHGLLITPEHGPRVRLAAVFTSIKNLPVTDTNTHAWIRDYCN